MENLSYRDTINFLETSTYIFQNCTEMIRSSLGLYSQNNIILSDTIKVRRNSNNQIVRDTSRCAKRYSICMVERLYGCNRCYFVFVNFYSSAIWSISSARIQAGWCDVIGAAFDPSAPRVSEPIFKSTKILLNSTKILLNLLILQTNP